MDLVSAVWLGFTIATPVATFPGIALLRLLHTKRTSWRPLDILVVTLVVAQLFATLLTFGFSTIYLLRQAGLLANLLPSGIETTLCATLVCGWSAAHTLHAATLSSVAVDRVLLIRWPYKYHLSIGHTQTGYHVVVLAVVSVLVGVAALFARTSATPIPSGSSPESCLHIPHMFDTRFAVFWLCLHGFLLAATVVASVVVSLTCITLRCAGSDPAGSGSDLRTLGTTSEASATSGTLLTNHSCYADTSTATVARKTVFSEPMRSAGRNLTRCPAVATLLLVSYLTYHLPLLVLTVMGTFFWPLLPEWPFPAVALGLGLLQSLLMLVILVTVDPVIRSWMVDSVRPKAPAVAASINDRRSTAFARETSTLDQSFSSLKLGSSHASLRTQMTFQDPVEVKFPLTNGSLVAHLMNTALAADYRSRTTSRYGISSLPNPDRRDESPASLSTFQKRPALEPFYSDPLMDGEDFRVSETFTTRAQINEPIYATLSETFSTSLRRSECGSESATESAGEDFEFHDTRCSAWNRSSSRDKRNLSLSLNNLDDVSPKYNSQSAIKTDQERTNRVKERYGPDSLLQIVSLDALHNALKRSSSTSYLDNGCLDVGSSQEKTVFVSGYL